MSAAGDMATQLTKARMRQEAEYLLAWWTVQMVDDVSGGYYGRRDFSGSLVPDAPKGVILNARILWSFSHASRITKDKRYQYFAQRAFEYFTQYFIDPVYGGVYWMLDAAGRPLETKKQIYAQAFAIYALSEYALMSGDAIAGELASEIFELVEVNSLDLEFDGYIDAFDREWEPIEDVRLSDVDMNAPKTMNTHLHLLEAYTLLVGVHQEKRLVCEKLRDLIHCFTHHILDKSTGHLRMFFGMDWTPLSKTISYGHDIECSWLLTEAAVALQDPILIGQCHKIAVQMAHAVLKEGVDLDGTICNEKDETGHVPAYRDWWVQAEAVVGFMNAWEISGRNDFRDASRNVWRGIEQHFRDPIHGEWHWGVDINGNADITRDKAGPWKAPYHNTRMCFEMIRRLHS